MCEYTIQVSRSRCTAIWTMDSLRQVRHDVVDASGQGFDVSRLDRGEHCDAELVAAELAVRLGVENSVGPQRFGNQFGVDAAVEIDRADDVRALVGIDDVWRGVGGLLGPRVQPVR